MHLNCPTFYITGPALTSWASVVGAVFADGPKVWLLKKVANVSFWDTGGF